jgi:quinol-cytochrome oxidoreductase complex cytochrome b subunit
VRRVEKTAATIKRIRNVHSYSTLRSHRKEPSNPFRIFKTFVFHIRPRQVTEKTLRFTLTFGLGGMAVVLVTLQLFTGILLKFAYEPFPTHAYDSLIRLQTEYAFGQFIRNIHFWSANFLVGVLLLHGLRVLLTGAFQPPRRVNWIVGLILFILVLASNLTGYLLPWDQLAFWATTICLGMLEYIPGFGSLLQQWLMGGTQIGAATLRNFFALHTAVLPVAMISLMAYHFWRVRKAGGLVVPRSANEMPEEKPDMVPSNPSLLLREAAVALSVAAIVSAVALLFDAPLGAPANPGLSPNPTKAPWYFAGVQEMLVHFHPTFALLIVLGAALGAFFILPYLGGAEDAAGVWFASAVGRRTSVFAAVTAGLITSLAVILDEYVIDLAGWLTGWPQVVLNGLIPTVMLLLVLAGLYVVLTKGFRAPRPEAIQAVFIFLAVGLVELTVICIFFRVEGMKLGWVFR